MAQQRWDELVEDSVGGPVTAGTMFGSRGLRTGRKFFAVWWHDQLVLKLPTATAEPLLSTGVAVPFEPMEGRRMNGWYLVGDGADWTDLARGARAHVESQQQP